MNAPTASRFQVERPGRHVPEQRRSAAGHAELLGEPVVKVNGMKNHTLLAILASLALASAGCSKQTRSAGLPKNNDLGVLDVSSGKPSRRILADGRYCNITPTILPNGNVSLTTSIVEPNGSTTRSRTLTFEAPADGRAYSFGFDESTVITLALRK